jgi:hypothetical protein
MTDTCDTKQDATDSSVPFCWAVRFGTTGTSGVHGLSMWSQLHEGQAPGMLYHVAIGHEHDEDMRSYWCPLEMNRAD